MDIYLLHIETATKVCSVALSCNGKLIASKETDDSNYVHGEVLTLFIQDLMAETKVSLQQLSAISVASGPGSYTGLRIGVSTAKGLCFALGIPLIAVDSLISLAYLAKKNGVSQAICAMIDARRMEVFSAIYDNNLQLIKPISADILDENTYGQFEPFTAIGDGAAKVGEIWSSRNIAIDTTIQSSAVGQIELAFIKFNEQNFENVAYFEPFYLKDFVSTKK
ncbi:MAG TPA: tRNA (adenosine(37)-N6)-threonylcarbamoyltransferase complex dimerization subunit type 1 TsaB [Taishania sp.]|nr:tRNA (adenosine(37)-N6)-threonylcarbamoyltransferase complex dimerization subunit type 1 TsaB [Taishania sp.]